MAQSENRGTKTGERLVVESRESADGSLELLITDSSAEDSEFNRTLDLGAPPAPPAQSIRPPIMLAAAALIAVVLGAVTWAVLHSPEETPLDDEEISSFRPYAGTEVQRDENDEAEKRAAAAVSRRSALQRVEADQDDEGDDPVEEEYEREEFPLDRVLRARGSDKIVIEPPEARMIEASGHQDQRALLRTIEERLDDGARDVELNMTPEALRALSAPSKARALDSSTSPERQLPSAVMRGSSDEIVEPDDLGSLDEFEEERRGESAAGARAGEQEGEVIEGEIDDELGDPFEGSGEELGEIGEEGLIEEGGVFR